MQQGFGEKLKRIRLEKETPLEVIANVTGVSEALLQKVEDGEKQPRFSYPVIEKMAEVLDVEIDELIDIQVG